LWEEFCGGSGGDRRTSGKWKVENRNWKIGVLLKSRWWRAVTSSGYFCGYFLSSSKP
jgi:hypothetical protein